MNFFFDNMMSPTLAEMMGVLTKGEHIIRHIKFDQRFPLGGGTPDAVWIPALKADRQEWCVISGDIRMLQNPTIIAQLHQSDIIFFCMDRYWCSGNIANSQAWKLLKIWPEIEARARGPRPAFYEIGTRDNPRVEELKWSKRARRRNLKLEP